MRHFSTIVIMLRRLFLLVIVLTWFPGGFSKQSPPKPTVVLAGRAAILPCYFSSDDDPLFVEWSKEHLHPNVVVLYREGKEEHRLKDKTYRYRTSLVRPEMDNSDKSLRIADVQLSDEGNYTCKGNIKINNKNKIRDVTTVWLSVVTVSSPELTLVQSTNGTTVQCGVRCWPCEVEMEFLDREGNVLPSDEQKLPSEERGFYNVTRKMLVPDKITRVTCRVNQTKINQTWHQTLSVPDYCKVSCAPIFSNTTTICIGVLISIIIIGIIIIFSIIVFFKSRESSNNGHSKTSLETSAPSVRSSGNSEDSPLIEGSRVKSDPQSTGDGTHQQQRNKTPQLSPKRDPHPAQASAASSSTTSTVNAALQGAGVPQVPKQNTKVNVPQSKPGNRKHTGKTKQSKYDFSAASTLNILKHHSHYHTVPLLSTNRYAPLSVDNPWLSNAE